MGNKNSSDAGAIYIRTEKPQYYAGETCSGNIYLNLKDNFIGNTISLKIKGKEITSFKKGRNTRGTNHAFFGYEGGHMITNHEMPVYVFQSGNVPQGQYVFPFSFVLNGMLPGSFLDRDQRNQGEIRYKLKAELLPTNPKDRKKKSIRCSIPLFIQEPVKSELKPIAEQQGLSIKTFACIPQGFITLKASLDRNAYSLGSEVPIKCEIDNGGSTADITRIIVKLKRRVQFDSGRGDSFTMDDDVIVQEFPGIRPNVNAMGDKGKSFTLKLMNNQNTRAIQPTTTGHLIKSSYWIEVTTGIDFVCCQGMPKVEIPIIIFNNIIQQDSIQIPTNWAPQEMPIANIVWNDENALPDSRRTSGKTIPVVSPRSAPYMAEAPPLPGPYV